MGYYLAKDRVQNPPISSVPPKSLTPVSALQQRGLRFYKPEVGRWISKDPIGEKIVKVVKGNRVRYDLSQAEPNLFSFVQNSCVNGVDPDGRNPCLAYALYRAIIKDNKKPDTWKHCYVSCMGKRCDAVTTMPGQIPPTDLAATLFELLQLIEDVPQGTLEAIRGFVRDMNSNAKGKCCAFQIWRSCERCCEDE